MKKPNILWICTDQQRFDTLGCYGNTFVNTPHLDRLAQNGVLFENAFCQNPVCTPSRASFLTGRYPRTTRARQNGQSIPEDEVLITRILSDEGYICGLSGKLHLSPCNPEVQPIFERRINDGYSVFHWSHDQGDKWPGNEYIQWVRTKGGTHASRPHPDSKHIKIGPPREFHQTTWCAQMAIDFIETNARWDTPWLFSLNPFDPHHPFNPPELYLQRYLENINEIPLPNYTEGELDNKPLFQRIDHQGAYHAKNNFPFPEMSEKDHRMIRAAYWAMCDLIDNEVGRILDTLERTGQIDNTIVIFTSDHGEMLGDHGIYLKGPYFYEGAVHVPLLISWQGVIEPSHRSKALVELVDLPQTLLDALQLPHHPGMQGKSFWKLLNGEPELHSHRDDIYCEYYNSMGWHKQPTALCTMVRTPRYKIVVVHGQDVGELYDLEKDPNETDNLWKNDEFIHVKVNMLKRLSDRMSWTVDPLPPREGPW